MNVVEAAKGTIAANKFIENTVKAAKHSEGIGFSHAKWMLEEIAKGEMSDDKANRWLGYAQCILVVTKLASLEEVKNINITS